MLLFTNLSFGVNNNIPKEQDINIEKEIPQAPVSEREQKVVDFYNLKEATKHKVDETTDPTFRDKFRALITNSNLVATFLDLSRSRAKKLDESNLNKYETIPFNDFTLGQVIAKEPIDTINFRKYISRVNIFDWKETTNFLRDIIKKNKKTKKY